MLTEGSDYLYFHPAYHSGGAVTGLTNSKVAVIATRRYIFLVPIQETSLGLGLLGPAIKVRSHAFRVGDDKLSVDQMLARYLAEPDLTVELLEIELRDSLSADYVIAIDELASLKVWMLFRQVRYKRRGQRQARVLALRGKPNHERFKSFYSLG